MATEDVQNAIVIIKPDSYWNKIDAEIETRIKGLGLMVVEECMLGTNPSLEDKQKNLSKQEWEQFYMAPLRDKHDVREATSIYMSQGPVKVFHLRGPNAIERVRKLVGATRPWEAEKGTIRGDFAKQCEPRNEEYKARLYTDALRSRMTSKTLFFNMIHATSDPAAFEAEHKFFEGKLHTPDKQIV